MSFFAMDWSELSLQVMITFGHFLWQACLVAIVLIAVEQLSSMASNVLGSGRKPAIQHHASNDPTPNCMGRSANIRYTFACLAFFSLPVCVVSTFGWVHQSRGPFALALNEPITSASITAATVDVDTRSAVSEANSTVPPSQTPTEAALSPIESADLTGPPIPALSWEVKLQMFAPYLLVAYAIGVGLMMARFCISIIGSSRLRRKLLPNPDSNLLTIMAEQASRLGLKRVPIVALCQRVSVPVVVGIVKPMVLLPPALACGLDPKQLAAILSHELAHIRRYDLIVNVLQRIVEAFLFFHPITWWISRRLSVERENCCDDIAAACTGRLSYASALLHMADLCMGSNRRRRAALATLSADGANSTDFGYRIRRLIDAEETTRIGVTRRSFTVGLTLTSLLMVSLVAWGQNGQLADVKPKDESMPRIFTPEPLWQAKVGANEVASEMTRISPFVLAADRVLSIGKDFDLKTGKECENPFVRLPRTYEFGVTLEPIMRRKSSDRKYIVEVANRGPGNTWRGPACDIRVLRSTDGVQVGTTIALESSFDGNSCDVDVENGGNFLLLGMGNEVRVYRLETGKIETALPVKIKRVDALAFCPDRKWLVVSDRNDLHFWRWRDQAAVKTIHAGRKIDSLVFTPDGQYLAEGPDAREDVQIRDMRTFETVASLKDEVGSPLMVSSMDITPDARYLVAHNEVSVDKNKLTIPHRIHVWDLKTRGKPVFQIATGEWVRSVAFSNDGRTIVGEFSGATHGALLAAWRVPDELMHRKVDSPRDAKDRLGDNIQWSTWGDSDGLLSGARLILPEGGLKSGQPLVVEYRLANVSAATKVVQCYLNKGTQFTAIASGNRIGGYGLAWHREPVTLSIEPGDVFIDVEHLVSVDTTGLAPGTYHAALGSAFHIPDDANPQSTLEIPHRGSIPFTIVGESTFKIRDLPKSDIQWGKPIAGLQLGARFVGDPKAFAIDGTVEADLFAANVTDQPIEFLVILPNPSDGWLFNVVDHNGDTIMLQRPIPFSVPFPEERVQLKLLPGEVKVLTGEQSSANVGKTLAPRAKFEIAHTKIDEAKWSDNSIKGRLVTQGGSYSAIFEAMLFRPEIPALRLELDSGSVPFTVSNPVELNENSNAKQPQATEKDKESTSDELWRGTEVDGRLLWPDRTPAAGVRVTVGVYINNQSWKEKLGMDLTSYSFDHGDWPNWSRTIVTDEQGRFSVTVPPKDSRLWLRIGTTRLGFSPQEGHGIDGAVTQRLSRCVPLEIQYGGNSRENVQIVSESPDAVENVLHAGDLQLETGVIVRGRVVDAEGKSLSNIHLTTTGQHGPHSGRTATSGDEGKFEFPAMAAGNLTVHPDARLRDDKGQDISRDVQAVFVDQTFAIPETDQPHEITIRAVPHTEVRFEWVDRRADKTQPIAYYGAFRVRGSMPQGNAEPSAYWTSETERIERDGKPWLSVKIPTQLLNPELMLVADSKVTASYSDSTGVTSGPGIVQLGDITANISRTIFGDESQELVASQKAKALNVQFDVVDADRGEPVRDAVILFKEDEATWYEGELSDYATGAAWAPFQIIEDGQQTFQASTPDIMGKAHILIAAKGFEPVTLKLNEGFEGGRPIVKQVRMKTAPPVEFILATATGAPAIGATLETLKSKELRAAITHNGGTQLDHFLKINLKSDAQGVVRIPSQPLSNWTTYRIEHPAGYVNVRGKDLPKVDAAKSPVARKIQLIPYASIQGEYRPQIRTNEYLEFVRLQSNRQTVDGPAQLITLDKRRRFEVTKLFAGWYSFVHRVRHEDSGSTAIALYGPYEVKVGMESELKIGNDGRSVVGRFMLSESAAPGKRPLTVSVTSGQWPGYPTAPFDLDSDATLVWWNAYWASDKGQQFRAYNRRSYRTAIADDGRFYFPSLPIGKYSLSLDELQPIGTYSKVVQTEFVIDRNEWTPIDLGDLSIEREPQEPEVVVKPDAAVKPVPTGPRKLVATIFGTTVYLDQLGSESPKEVLGKLPPNQAAAKRLEMEGEALLRLIARRAVEDYTRRQKIVITPEMSNKLLEVVNATELPPNPDSPISEQQQRAGLQVMLRGSLMDWLVCKSLYERYGGRVGMGSLGLWIAVDGRNELMREYLKKGSIVISDAELEKAFWKAANKPNFADAYPKGDDLKRLMSTPPFLTERPKGSGQAN